MKAIRSIVAFVCYLSILSPVIAFADTALLSPGFNDSADHHAWEKRFGTFDGSHSIIDVVSGACVQPDPKAEECAGGLNHAEAQHVGVIGADFHYSADLTITDGAEAHLQFRISSEGRYGVRLSPKGIALYDFHFPPRSDVCSDKFPGITHCPTWTYPDLSAFQIIQEIPRSFASTSSHRLEIWARGSIINVSLDGEPIFKDIDTKNPQNEIGRTPTNFRVGRFGIYAFGDASALKGIHFANVSAVTNPLASSNFALLYSTLGYEVGRTTRAIVRTLNDVADGADLDSRSNFTLRRTDGMVTLTGPLTGLSGKTFGMQLWEADFSKIDAEGSYTLDVDLAHGVRLQSSPFEIRTKLFSNHIVKPMSLANAEVRRAADEDFWRNWVREPEEAPWSVGVDGAFIADRADDGAGASLIRVFNINNEPLDGIAAQNFRFVGRVTIISGCDAQMRFEDKSGNWWAVTLQAGEGGGCRHGSGPGAIRLSREGLNREGKFEFVTLVSTAFPADHPFLAGRPYNIQILVRNGTIRVFLDKPHGEEDSAEAILSYDGIPARSGGFALKAWASTARFEDVQA